MLSRERILSARGLDSVVRRLRAAEVEMGSDDADVRDKAMQSYERADAALHAAGGYSVEAEAAQIASANWRQQYADAIAAGIWEYKRLAERRVLPRRATDYGRPTTTEFVPED